MTYKIKPKKPDFMARHKSKTEDYYNLFKKMHMCMLGYCYAGKMADDRFFDYTKESTYETNKENYWMLMKSIERKTRKGMVDSAVSDIVCNYMSIVIEHLTNKLSDISGGQDDVNESMDRYVKILLGINKELVETIGTLFLSKEVHDIMSRYLNSVVSLLVIKFFKKDEKQIGLVL